ARARSRERMLGPAPPSGRHRWPVLAALGGRSAWLSIPHENRLQSPSRGLTQEAFICNAGRPLGLWSAAQRKPEPGASLLLCWPGYRDDRTGAEMHASFMARL